MSPCPPKTKDVKVQEEQQEETVAEQPEEAEPAQEEVA